jgi:hypothetical protein
MGKFVITEEEKRRILNMHQSKYTKNVLKEDVSVGEGSILDNGKKIISIGKPTKAGNPPSTAVFIQTDEDGTGGNFVCRAHEGKNYKLTSSNITLTPEESQALYDTYCKAV